MMSRLRGMRLPWAKISSSSIVLIRDAIGLTGRGWLSKAKATTPDGTVQLTYERIERAYTPSVMSLETEQLGKDAP